VNAQTERVPYVLITLVVAPTVANAGCVKIMKFEICGPDCY